MDRGLKFIVVVLALFVAGLGGFALGVTSGEGRGGIQLFGSSADSGLDVIEDAFQTIREESDDPPSEAELARAAVKAMLRVLREKDDYAVYYDQAAYEDFLDYSSGSFSGIGVNLSQAEGRLTVISVIPSTPAEEAGLMRGDVFFRIGGKLVSDMSDEEAIGRVKGPPGSEVALTVLRDGEEVEFEITRAEISFPNLVGKLAGNVGYIRLFGFAKGAGKELREEVSDLREGGAEGIVLDLRDNGGGLLSEAIQVASVFIEDGEIVTYREKAAEDLVYEAEGDAFEDVPLVVLVNGGTASASEIVANALQDRDRGQLVGTTTFGKGSVQEIIDLPDDSAVKLTTGTYLSPDGEDIDGSGIEPDVEVDGSRADQRRRAFALLEQLADAGTRAKG
jgi:carboxyl-terminal processing protease